MCHISNTRNIKHLPFPLKEWGHFILIKHSIFSLTMFCVFQIRCVCMFTVQVGERKRRDGCFMSADNNSDVPSLMQPFKATAFHCSFICRDSAHWSLFQLAPVSMGMWEKLAQGAPNRRLNSSACRFLPRFQNMWLQVRWYVSKTYQTPLHRSSDGGSTGDPASESCIPAWLQVWTPNVLREGLFCLFFDMSRDFSNSSLSGYSYRTRLRQKQSYQGETIPVHQYKKSDCWCYKLLLSYKVKTYHRR